MKRYICLLFTICLILVSFSFCFAVDWSTSDQTNLQNAANRLYYNGYSAAYYLYQINSKLSTISGYLFDDGHSIAYWTSAISTWMQPIYNSITAVPTDLEDLSESLTNIKNGQLMTSSDFYTNAHYKLMNQTFLDGRYNVSFLNTDGTASSPTYYWNQGTPIGNLALLSQLNTNNMTNGFRYIGRDLMLNNKDTQNAVNWGSLSTSSFTPTSTTDGLYKWLSAIQAPVARLSYVLANQEDIEAREAASANQALVVDEFIDSSGDASVSTSDIGSISDLSSGYQQNFGSTASVTGIFDIFDSSNFGWFSSETYNQLDTTVAQRGSSFETPLLDQQLEDISRALGVDYVN